MYVTMIIFLTGENNLSWLVTVVTDDNLDMRGLGCFILPTFAANLQAASFTAYVLFIWLIVRFLVTEACSVLYGGLAPFTRVSLHVLVLPNVRTITKLQAYLTANRRIYYKSKVKAGLHKHSKWLRGTLIHYNSQSDNMPVLFCFGFFLFFYIFLVSELKDKVEAFRASKLLFFYGCSSWKFQTSFKQRIKHK